MAGRVLFGSDLDTLALINDTDKNTGHRYTKLYAQFLASYRKQPVKLLEIGIGGYAEGSYVDPQLGGGSLRMWRTYFPRGRIFGIDIQDKSPHDERRIRTFRGSQADLAFLTEVIEQTGPIDIVIDDGSHNCGHVISSFEFLFPRMTDRGLYIVEDVQTSYWPEYGGDSIDPDRPTTTLGYFKRLIHGVNHAEQLGRSSEPTYYDKNIVGISFYHNLIVIEKAPNTDGSPLRERLEPLRPADVR